MDDWYTYKDLTPREAAACIIFSAAPDGTQEVLLGQRNKKLKFMGGHYAFLGGALDKNDPEDAVAGAPDAETARAIFAAAREVFEETGILCVRDTPSREVLRDLRKRLMAGTISFSGVLDELGVVLDAKAFTSAGIWITPPFSPIRFRTQYFVYYHEGERYEEVESEDGEIVDLLWIAPFEARRRWHENRLLISTPVAFILHHLASLPLEAALPWLHLTPGYDTEAPNRFELRRGMHLIPVLSPTLPPATRTNCIIVGEERLLIIDPGAHDEPEQAYLIQHIEHLVALGGKVEAIVLTHGHPDHTGSALLLAEKYGAPIWAHAETGRQTGLPLGRELADGDVIELPGDPGWRIVCLHTPGHDPGHLAFLETTTRTLIAGDLIANPGTIIISPDYEGDMTQYLDSLNRVIEQDFNFLLPAHGLPFWGQGEKASLRALVEHRQERERKIVEAIEAGAATRSEVIERAYADTPKEAWGLADHQLRAHLIRLGLEMAE